MKLSLLYGRLDHLMHQRNALFSLVVTLLILNILQALVTVFGGERIVVMPPDLKREVWIARNRISASYLEEMTLFFADLILEMSPESAPYKREIILRHSLHDSYGALKAKLLEDERFLKHENVVTSFQPNAVKVNTHLMQVDITGDLLRFVGLRRVSQSRDTYRFTFVYRHGRLLIQSFQLLKSDKDA